MEVSRRSALALVGGGTILAAAGGGFALTRTPTRALEPWKRAGQYEEPRRRALSYAILAPNPHNRQPWLADLREPDTVILHRDRTRDLPQTDPFERQLTIGMGCFLELLAIAASQDGHAVAFALFPDGEEGPIAVARFRKGGAPDPLFAQVLDRRSCKEPFEDRPVPKDMVKTLAAYARIIDDPPAVSQIVALSWDAWTVEAKTPRTLRESVELMRFGRSEIEASPDGVDLGGPFLEALMAVGAVSRRAQLDPSSFAFQEGVRIYEEMLKATPAYAVLTTPTNTRLDQIEAGRRWLRLNLATTSLGLALHPVSQALQEFPEMAGCFKRAHDLLAEPGHTVQMLGRLGFGPSAPASPRWPLETRIRNG